MAERTVPRVRHIALVGMAGAGKTTIGRILGEMWGLPVVDLDEIVERCTGRSVVAVFDDEGEAVFRRHEAAALHEALDARSLSIVSCGGGVVTTPVCRELLRAPDILTVWLTAGLHTLRDRLLCSSPERPLLRDPEALPRLWAERRPLYESVADTAVATDGRVVSVVAREVARQSRGVFPLSPVPFRKDRKQSRILRVPLPEHSYDVEIGPGVFSGVGAAAAALGAEKVAFLTHSHLGEKFPEVRASLREAGLEVIELPVPEGEKAKSFSVLEEILQKMALAEMRRDDLVVGMGGGVVTDLAGFAAAVFLRGVPWIACSTTILGAVDAAVGGKTAVNLAAGKNLAGAFWQPSRVFIDTFAFKTLPERQMRSGLAEVVKHGLIADPEILDIVEGWGPSPDLAALVSDAGEEKRFVELVARSVMVKADIVSIDEREGSVRALLNYGHTLGHALETACAGRLAHGEAVAIGMVFAAELACVRGGIDRDLVDLHRRLLGALGLAVSALPADLVVARPLMRRDKKHRKNQRFVLLSGLGTALVAEDVCESEIEAALVLAARS